MDIRLKKLSFKNFKGIKNLEIDLGPVNNIRGDNATGKTTVFDGFNWLLFGKDSQDRKDFEIKTLDKNGEPFHNLEHNVTGLLSVDGFDIELSRTFKEKWVKERGQASQVFSGHTTIYHINNIPVSQKEYQTKISDLVGEENFKLLTNPLMFNGLNWKKQREILTQLVPEISIDDVLKVEPKLKDIINIIKDKDNDVEILKKEVRGKIKKIKDQLLLIPTRIDECNNQITEVDYKEAKTKIGIKKAQLINLDLQLGSKTEANQQKLKLQEQLYNLKKEYNSKLFEFEELAKKPLNDLKLQLREIFDDKQNLFYRIRQTRTAITRLEQLVSEKIIYIENNSSELVKLRGEYKAEAEEQFVFDENKTVCSACGRAYDIEKISNLRETELAYFNTLKEENLSKINKKGKALKEENGRLTTSLNNTYAEIEQHKTILEKIQIEAEEKDKLEIEIKAKVKEIENNNFEYPGKVEYQTKIQGLQKELLAFETGDNTVIDNKKREILLELEKLQNVVSIENNNILLKKRINALEIEEKNLCDSQAMLENQEYLFERATRCKAELLEKLINQKFEGINFKLFNTQINGGLEETCVCTVNGVPYQDINNAAKINSGLAIIKVLSQVFDVKAPIFIDNRESTNKIIDMDCQIINLIVSKDKGLVINE